MKKLVIIGHKDDCVQLRSGYDFRGKPTVKEYEDKRLDDALDRYDPKKLVIFKTSPWRS